MRINRHSARKSGARLQTSDAELVAAAQRGVALVVTLIMLAVITFMAITFLALSRREAGAVRGMTDQITVRNAADTAFERVKAELLAAILGSTNVYNVNLFVSTNFLNWDGFDPSAGGSYTNVNYGYRIGGGALSPNDALQNLANLFWNARPPVFVTNRFFANSNDFRYYWDINRNGRYDTNGLWPVISPYPLQPFYDTNGNPMATILPGQTLSNYFVGDPEFIGVLERPDLPHSASNRFIARYAFVVIPAGKTLDLNFAHNHARLFTSQLGEGFLRNEGVGPWEINLAAFLVDLNTNLWLVPPYGSDYIYRNSNPNSPTPSSGVAFDDAFQLLRYRHGGPFNSLAVLDSVQGLFGPDGTTAFNNDGVDGYTAGPLLTKYWGLNVPPDPDVSRTLTRPWHGSDNRFAFFTTQDLFDSTKTKPLGGAAMGLTDRLKTAGTNTSSYDRYTFNRLLSQLGTDSAPEEPGKINPNYANIGGLSATNFIPWNDVRVANWFGRPGSEVFFTAAVDRLLKTYTEEWRNANPNFFKAAYGTNQSFNLSGYGIPVWVSNRFVYSPSIQRLLQVAANIYDATSNTNNSPALPTVFRPIFKHAGNDIYISDFREVNSVGEIQTLTLRNLANTNVAANVQPNDLIFGVPLVVGAKKGLPNFNEFAMHSFFHLTRKLEIKRPSVNAPKSAWTTNMMYILNVTNWVGAEAWNSYQGIYTRPVQIMVTNYISMNLLATNDAGNRVLNYNPVMIPIGNLITSNNWLGYNPRGSETLQNRSLVAPIKRSISFVPDSAYQDNGTFIVNPSGFVATGPGFLQPQFGLNITNAVQMIMVDQQTGRIIDYVHLNGLVGVQDVSHRMADPDGELGYGGLWSTNRLGGAKNVAVPFYGVQNQIDVSLGNYSGDGADFGKWRDPSGGTEKGPAIANFRAFMSPSHIATYVDESTGQTYISSNSNLVQQVPFTPTKRLEQKRTWQANDPLVHYTAEDLTRLEEGDGMVITPLSMSNAPIDNIGWPNPRYDPWGGNPKKGYEGNPNAFNLTFKDPVPNYRAVNASDAWQFLTNRLPNPGWLGRIHRGTPWQTVYMKSADADTNATPAALNEWQKWIGNPSYDDAMLNRPGSDRLLFDVFTTAFNDNSSRGQLPINQDGLAAWSALFTGVVALTNSATSVLKLDPVFNKTGTGYGIDPVGFDGTNSPLWQMVNGPAGINATRATFPHGEFQHVGDILSVPALTASSPFLNPATAPPQLQNGLNDAAYEWLPQQVMGLLRMGGPRFVVYAYGQALRPADRSILTTGGPFFQICTNYQITAEIGTRAVVRVEGSPDPGQANNPDPAKRYPPHIVVESFNLLGPD